MSEIKQNDCNPNYCSNASDSCPSCLNLLQARKRVHETRLVLAQLEEEERIAYSLFNERHDPIRSLPNELISRIFLAFRDEETPSKLPQDLSYTLAQVCRAWRHVAFQTPQLWEDITLNLNVEPGNTPREQRTILALRVAKFEASLARSKSLPVAVHTVSIASLWLEEDLPLWKSIIGALQDCSPRIYHLDLVIPSHVPNDFPGFSAPMLERLNLKYLRKSRVRQVDEKNLKTTKPRDLFIRWDRLAEVTLSQCALSCAIPILRQGTSIRRYHCQQLTDDLPLFQEIETSTHERLEELSLEADFEDYTSNFFRYFTLPSLKSIVMHGKDISTDDASEEHLEDFLRRSSCPVKRLHLLIPILSPQGVDRSLQQLSTLEDLHLTYKIDRPHSTTDIFRSVFRTASDLEGELRNPALRSLTIESLWGGQDPYSGWEFLRPLRRFLARLQRLVVKIDFRRSVLDDVRMNPETVELIRELRVEGREIIFSVVKKKTFIEDLVEASASEEFWDTHM